jgi:hypothetical protein
MKEANKVVLIGLRPWFPWPLCRWRWLTEPVPAERLAILRIGLAAVLLIDILCTYLPDAATFFGKGSLGAPELYRRIDPPPWSWDATQSDVRQLPDDIAKGGIFHRTLSRSWRWSLLDDVEDLRILQACLIAWAIAAGFLLVGLLTRFAALVVWLLTMSFAYLCGMIDNAGDQVRYIVALYLMLTPCGAAWSLDAWLRRRRGRLKGRACIYPWVLRLLFVQLVMIYWTNGLYKASGYDWRHGDSLYYVLGDLTLTRWSYAQFPTPYPLTQALTWMVLVWEVGFPLWVCPLWAWLAERLEGIGLDRPRFALWVLRHAPLIALCFGVAFHLGIALTMELGFFVPYMLCLYLPLLPVERWQRHDYVMDAIKGCSTRAYSA